MRQLFDKLLQKQKWLLLAAILVATAATAATALYNPNTEAESNAAAALRKQKAKIELTKTVGTRDASASSATQGSAVGLRFGQNTDTTLVTVVVDPTTTGIVLMDSIAETTLTDATTIDTAVYNTYKFTVHIDTAGGVHKRGGNFVITYDTAGSSFGGTYQSVTEYKDNSGTDSENGALWFKVDTGLTVDTKDHPDTTYVITVHNLPSRRTGRDGSVPTEKIDTVYLKVAYTEPVVVHTELGDGNEGVPQSITLGTAITYTEATALQTDTVLRADTTFTFYAHLDTTESWNDYAANTTKLHVGGKIIVKSDGANSGDTTELAGWSDSGLKYQATKESSQGDTVYKVQVTGFTAGYDTTLKVSYKNPPRIVISNDTVGGYSITDKTGAQIYHTPGIASDTVHWFVGTTDTFFVKASTTGGNWKIYGRTSEEPFTDENDEFNSSDGTNPYVSVISTDQTDATDTIVFHNLTVDTAFHVKYEVQALDSIIVSVQAKGNSDDHGDTVKFLTTYKATNDLVKGDTVPMLTLNGSSIQGDTIIGDPLKFEFFVAIDTFTTKVKTGGTLKIEYDTIYGKEDGPAILTAEETNTDPGDGKLYYSKTQVIDTLYFITVQGFKAGVDGNRSVNKDSVKFYVTYTEPADPDTAVVIVKNATVNNVAQEGINIKYDRTLNSSDPEKDWTIDVNGDTTTVGVVKFQAVVDTTGTSVGQEKHKLGGKFVLAQQDDFGATDTIKAYADATAAGNDTVWYSVQQSTGTADSIYTFTVHVPVRNNGLTTEDTTKVFVKYLEPPVVALEVPANGGVTLTNLASEATESDLKATLADTTTTGEYTFYAHATDKAGIENKTVYVTKRTGNAVAQGDTITSTANDKGISLVVTEPSANDSVFTVKLNGIEVYGDSVKLNVALGDKVIILEPDSIIVSVQADGDGSEKLTFLKAYSSAPGDTLELKKLDGGSSDLQGDTIIGTDREFTFFVAIDTTHDANGNPSPVLNGTFVIKYDTLYNGETAGTQETAGTTATDNGALYYEKEIVEVDGTPVDTLYKITVKGFIYDNANVRDDSVKFYVAYVPGIPTDSVNVTVTDTTSTKTVTLTSTILTKTATTGNGVQGNVVTGAEVQVKVDTVERTKPGKLLITDKNGDTLLPALLPNANRGDSITFNVGNVGGTDTIIYVRYVVNPLVTINEGTGVTVVDTLGAEITELYAYGDSVKFVAFAAEQYDYRFDVTGVDNSNVELRDVGIGGNDSTIVVIKNVTADVAVTVNYVQGSRRKITVYGNDSVEVSSETLTETVNSHGIYGYVTQGGNANIAVEAIGNAAGKPGKFVYRADAANGEEVTPSAADDGTDSLKITIGDNDTTIYVSYQVNPLVTITADRTTIRVTDTATVATDIDDIYVDENGSAQFLATVLRVEGYTLFNGETKIPDTDSAAHANFPDSVVYTVKLTGVTESKTVTLTYKDTRTFHQVEVTLETGLSFKGTAPIDSIQDDATLEFKVKVANPVVPGGQLEVTVDPASLNAQVGSFDDSDSTYTVTITGVTEDITVDVKYLKPALVTINGTGKWTTDQNGTTVVEKVYATSVGGDAKFYVTVPKQETYNLIVTLNPTTSGTVVLGEGSPYTSSVPEAADSTIYEVAIHNTSADATATVSYSPKASVVIYALNGNVQLPNPPNSVIKYDSARNGEVEFEVTVVNTVTKGGSISVLQGLTPGGTELIGRNLNYPGETPYAIAQLKDLTDNDSIYTVTIYGITSSSFNARVGYVTQPTVTAESGTTGVSVQTNQTVGVANADGTYKFNVSLDNTLAAYRNAKFVVETDDNTAPTPVPTVTGSGRSYTVNVTGVKKTTTVTVKYETVNIENWTVLKAVGDTTISTSRGDTIDNGTDAENGTVTFEVELLTTVATGGKYFFAFTSIEGSTSTVIDPTVDTTIISTRKIGVTVKLPEGSKNITAIRGTVGYVPPANVPKYVEPTKKPVFEITVDDKPVGSISTGEVAVSSSNKGTAGIAPPAYEDKGSIVPGGSIESTIDVSPEAVVITTPQTLIITFSGGLAKVLPYIVVPNVEVNHSVIRIVYIFDNSTKSANALATKALATRAVELRDLPTTSWAEVGPDNIIYIHLVNIDMDAVGEEETQARATIENLVENQTIEVGEVNKVIYLYDAPIVLVPDNGVPSFGYPGYFTLSGVYPTDGQLLYRLDNDPNGVYKSYFPKTGLLASEIDRLANGEKLYFAIWGARTQVGDIYVYLPKTYDNAAGGDVNIPQLARNVNVQAAAVSEGLIDFESVSGQWISTDGTFTFKVTPANPIPGYVLSLQFYTKEWILVTNKPEVSGHDTPNEDGTFTVILKSVKVSDLQVVVTYTQGGEVGNANVDADKVWASQGTLFINSTTTGVAKVFAVNGQLVKTVKVDANNTSTVELPNGNYFVVTPNGKTTKVNAK